MLVWSTGDFAYCQNDNIAGDTIAPGAKQYPHLKPRMEPERRKLAGSDRTKRMVPSVLKLR